MSAWVLWVPVALLTLAVLVLVLALRRERAGTRAQVAATQALLTVLEERIAALERPGATQAGRPGADGRGSDRPGSDEGRSGEPELAATGRHVRPSVPSADPSPAYVVTRLDDPEQAASSDRRIDGSLFADLVLRETMVRSVSLAYGLGRAFSPEARNRIWFLMRQEVKRSRKQRRADLRAARRHLADLRRAEESAA